MLKSKFIIVIGIKQFEMVFDVFRGIMKCYSKHTWCMVWEDIVKKKL